MYIFDKPEAIMLSVYLLFLTKNLYPIFLIYSQAITQCYYTYIIV